MLIKNYLILVFVGYLLTFSLVESLKCGRGALNPNGQQNNIEFWVSGVKKASYKGLACRFNKDGVLQITAEKTFVVSSDYQLGKWVDGEVRYLNVKKNEKKRFFITKNKKTVWIKDIPKPKPTTAPPKPKQFKCKDGKAPIKCKIYMLSYAYGGPVGNYEGNGCLLSDSTGNNYWEFEEEASFFDVDRLGRWFNGDLWYEHFKPTKKMEGIQLFLSKDEKTLKIKS